MEPILDRIQHGELRDFESKFHVCNACGAKRRPYEFMVNAPHSYRFSWSLCEIRMGVFGPTDEDNMTIVERDWSPLADLVSQQLGTPVGCYQSWW